jgi:DNA invertase Pin-like site-specific DNA recombinase
MRAAIYARMFTDKQNERSPADQVRECQRFAERHGYDVVPGLVFEEAGISGASRHDRPRLLELVARIDEWDVLLAFDFSRLARNQEDLGWIANRLRLHRRQAFEASTGLDLRNIGARVMGVVNEEYLEKLRADTHRGLSADTARG